MTDMIYHRRTVAVVGAGIGGLMSALALAHRGIHVSVFERDGAPPAGVAPADSMDWLRKGVPQSLHPHFFMGRLRLLLQSRYPELVERLFAAGVGENTLSDYVPEQVRHRFRPRGGDEALRSLNARRTTFEMIVRDYVAGLANVEIRDDARAVRPLVHPGVPPPLRVRGVVIETPSGSEEFEANAVIDASGRFGRLAAQLEALGARMRVDQRDSGIWYLTRHYRLKPGCEYPQNVGLPGAQFADFVVGALPADNGAYTITFQIYREDKAAAKALRDPEHFQAVCAALDAVAPWVDPAIAEPASDVFGFGQMDSFWRQTVVDGVPQVLDFYCVGDSCVRSNPKFGRGCTWTTVAAHHLADLLAGDGSSAERITRYEAVLEREFRKDWLTMRGIDRGTEAAFEVASGRRAPTIAERISQRFQAMVNEAMVTEPEVFREVWAGYHGLRGMTDWLRNPRVWPRLARSWLTPGSYPDLRASQRKRPSRQLLAGETVGP